MRQIKTNSITPFTRTRSVYEWKGSRRLDSPKKSEKVLENRTPANELLRDWLYTQGKNGAEFERQEEAAREETWAKWPIPVTLCHPAFPFHWERAGTMLNSSGLRLPWTISWTFRFLRHTSDISSMGTIRELTSAPEAASDKAWRNLARSTSVTAVKGINETQLLAHSSAWAPYALVNASSA